MADVNTNISLTEVNSNTPLQDFPEIYNRNNAAFLQKIDDLEADVTALKAVRSDEISSLSSRIYALAGEYTTVVGQIKAAYDTAISELKLELVEIGNRLTALENKPTE